MCRSDDAEGFVQYGAVCLIQNSSASDGKSAEKKKKKKKRQQPYKVNYSRALHLFNASAIVRRPFNVNAIKRGRVKLGEESNK